MDLKYEIDLILKYVRTNLSSLRSMLTRPDAAKAIYDKLKRECPRGELANLIAPVVMERAQGSIQESGLKQGLETIFKSQPGVDQELDYKRELEDEKGEVTNVLKTGAGWGTVDWDGGWFLPNGEVIRLGTYHADAHAELATNYLKEHPSVADQTGTNHVYDGSYDILFDAGWIRFWVATDLFLETSSATWNQRNLHKVQQFMMNLDYRIHRVYIDYEPNHIVVRYDEFIEANKPSDLVRLNQAKSAKQKTAVLIPHTLSNFQDNATNQRAAELFASYSSKFDIGKAIALTRRDLMRDNFDMLPAAPRPSRVPFTIPPSAPPKRQKPEPGPPLFDEEELRFPTGMIQQAAPSPLRVKVTNPQVDAKFFRLWMENLYNSGAYRPITHGAVQQGIRASDVLELPFYNVKIKDVAQIGSNLPDYDFLIQRVGNTGKVLTKTALQLNLINGTYTNYTIYTPKSVDDLMRLCQGTAWLCKKGQTEVLRDNAEYYYGKVRFVMEEGKPVAAVDYNEGAVWDPELNRLMSGPIVNFAKTELKDFKQAPAPEHPNWPVKAHGKVAALFHDRGWITAKGEWLPVKGAVDMDAESTEGEEHHDMIAEKYFRGGTDSAYNHGWIRIGVYGKEGYADMGGCNDKQFDVMWKHFAEVQPKYIIFGYLVEGRLDLEDFLMCKNLADLKKAIKRTYMSASGQPTMGFNVNDSAAPFTDWILRGEKEIETRNSDSLRSHIGERVGIIRTGVGPATLVGYCTLGEPIIYRDNRDFRQDQSQHMVPEGPMWDVFPGMIKYGYPILDVEPCEPKLITSQGRVWRRLASF